MAGLAKSISEQGLLFGAMVGFISLLAIGRLVWSRELTNCKEDNAKQVAKLEKENDRLQERNDALTDLLFKSAGLLARSADVTAQIVDRRRTPRDDG